MTQNADSGGHPDRVTERISEVELVGTFDAQVWAEQFMDRFAGRRIGPGGVDEGTMLGWFANAIMAGYDETAEQPCEHCGKWAEIVHRIRHLHPPGRRRPALLSRP